MLRRRALCLAAAALLAACAAPRWQQPGTPLPEVLAALGQPTLTLALPGGGQRLIYSSEPAGRQVLQAEFDAGQRLVALHQVMNEARFMALRPGVDTRTTVLQTFGPPALVEQVVSFRGDIWTYRLLENFIARQAHVHIDPAGVVQRVMFTDEEPDERFLRLR
ncbi:hypothetical protein KUD94_11960 [Comamonas sp. NLF-1-9]|nr:hypothetical protein KUD94_11960 [Comamonas sp. NLF-1-9]